jgi:hypothetical protein
MSLWRAVADYGVSLFIRPRPFPANRYTGDPAAGPAMPALPPKRK